MVTPSRSLMVLKVALQSKQSPSMNFKIHWVQVLLTWRAICFDPSFQWPKILSQQAQEPLNSLEETALASPARPID